MRCMNCGGNIDPEWVHAIQSNSCPGCGKEIMNEATQGLLKELSEAMEKMPNDPQGVAGWLLSNYRFQKMGSAEPVEKFHRPGGGGGGSSGTDNMKVDPTYNQFIKNSEAGALVTKGEELAKKFGKKEIDPKIAEMASAIAAAGDPYGEDGAGSEIDSSEEETPDESELKAYAEMKASGFDPLAASGGGGMTTGTLESMMEGVDKNVVNTLTGIMAKSSNEIDDEVALSQTDEGRRYLQRDRFKKLKAQDAVDGGGGGVFRR